MSFKHIPRTILLMSALATFGWTAPAPAADTTSSKPVTTSLLLALPDGSIVAVPPGPCLPAGELAVIAGDVHVVTQFRNGSLSAIHLNTAGMQGAGQTSGNLYIGTGSQKFSNLTVAPPDPDVPVDATFTLEHTDGCASDPLRLSLDLQFASDGTLLPSSTVFVPQNGIVNPPQ